MPAEPVIPQFATRTNAVVASIEWLFEPAWRGDRLMARLEHGRLRTLTDEYGEPAESLVADVREVIEPAVLATGALIDGVWTVQPFVGDGSAARHWAETIEREGLRTELPDPIEAERRRAFVAIDLVELDEQPLHDIPYQERRRLLESVIDEGIQVRLSPSVKQPVASWLIGWRMNGFSHYVAKHQNSRYEPGRTSPDWLQISVATEAPRGFMGRMLGSREPKPKRV